MKKGQPVQRVVTFYPEKIDGKWKYRAEGTETLYIDQKYFDKYTKSVPGTNQDRYEGTHLTSKDEPTKTEVKTDKKHYTGYFKVKSVEGPLFSDDEFLSPNKIYKVDNGKFVVNGFTYPLVKSFFLDSLSSTQTYINSRTSEQYVLEACDSRGNSFTDIEPNDDTYNHRGLSGSFKVVSILSCEPLSDKSITVGQKYYLVGGKFTDDSCSIFPICDKIHTEKELYDYFTPVQYRVKDSGAPYYGVYAVIRYHE